MKGVSFCGTTERAGKLIKEVMFDKLSLGEKISMKVKKVCDDPVVYHFIPRDKRILQAWKKMDLVDIEGGFILKICKGRDDAVELAKEFKLEVI